MRFSASVSWQKGLSAIVKMFNLLPRKQLSTPFVAKRRNSSLQPFAAKTRKTFFAIISVSGKWIYVLLPS